MRMSRRADNYLFFCPARAARRRLITDVLKTAANLGFHTVGLMYEDPVSMNSPVRGSAGSQRLPRHATGGYQTAARNAQISIANADSITNRLTKLLLYLNANNPTQNWEQYLTASSHLNWPMIVIAGHSQGAGHSGLIAKTYPSRGR